MFISNDFYDEYYAIVNAASTRGLIKPLIQSPDYIYYESHHIQPRSMGGSDDENNLVLLTAQEHYRCHELLPLFTEGKDKHLMLFAWNMMRSRFGGETYADHKEQHAIAMSKIHKGKSISSQRKKVLSKRWKGLNNPNYGGITDPKILKNMSESHKGIIQSQNTRDKRSKYLTGIKHPTIQCPHCNKSGGERAMKRWHFDKCKLKQ